MGPLESLLDIKINWPSDEEYEPAFIKANSLDDSNAGGSWPIEKIFFEKAFEMIEQLTFDPTSSFLDDYKKEILRNENSKYLNWKKIRGLEIKKFNTKYHTYIEALDKIHDLIKKSILSKMINDEIDDTTFIQNMKNLKKLSRKVLEAREIRLKPKRFGFEAQKVHREILDKWAKIESLFYPERFFKYPYIAEGDPLNMVGTEFKNYKATIDKVRPWKIFFSKLDQICKRIFG